MATASSQAWSPGHPTKATVAAGLELAKEYIAVLIDLQNWSSLRHADDPEPRRVDRSLTDYSGRGLLPPSKGLAKAKLEALGTIVKQARAPERRVSGASDEVFAERSAYDEDADPRHLQAGQGSILEGPEERHAQSRVVHDGVRIDGRGVTDIRPVDRRGRNWCQVPMGPGCSSAARRRFSTSRPSAC